MDPRAAHHLGTLTCELLTHGCDRVSFSREVHELVLGDPELDGREVNCIVVTATGAVTREIVAIEDVLVADGAGYVAALSASLRGLHGEHRA